MIVLPLNLILDLQQESEYGKIQENHWMLYLVMVGEEIFSF